MPHNDLQSLLRPADRFLRSVELIRDYRDPWALHGYCLTGFARQCLARIGEGLLPDSSRRSWRLTGDYGSGKSSFGLLLAGSLRNPNARFSKDLAKEVLEVMPALRHEHYLPVLVVGARESMSNAIVRSLSSALSDLSSGGRKSALENELAELAHNGTPINDQKVIDLVGKVSDSIILSGKAKGLVLILDEVGKFLEHAAQNPEQQDIYLLQKLAETASRSGKSPVLIVCLLHQGFNAYADQLTLTSQREWEKVAGRFEEIRFEQSLDQVVLIVGSALNVKLDKLEHKAKSQANASMEKAAELGWFGAAASKKSLREHAPEIFPIDPMALPVMVRTFQRFGQNERSLFSFLFSFEPFGLRTFCSTQTVSSARPYRLHDFYDYVRANFGHRLAVASYRSRWSVIESMIESFSSPEPLDFVVLKTIGILNLLNADDLLPTAEAIAWGIAANDKNGHSQVAASLKNLRKRGVIYFRGDVLGYCLWPHTSVDIEARYDEAKRNLPTLPNVADSIQKKLDTRPLVARRHYIESGNLRYFKVVYCETSAFQDAIQTRVTDADGIIVVPLCENDREYKDALKIAAETKGLRDRIQLLAVPKPLDKLSGCVLEALRWEWVMNNTPELNHDKYAREEVSRYFTQAQNTLQNRIQEYIGLNRVAGHTSLTWFYRGQELPIKRGRQLLTKLSTLCDKVYNQAPVIKNELLNRNGLSSAAAAARMRLLELMFSDEEKPDLGLPTDRKPPEKSMYLSVLHAAELHRRDGDVWKITNPTENDPCRVVPALSRIRQLIHEKPDTRIGIETIYTELRKPPYGLRDGLIPVLLAVIAIADEQEVALYENGTFLREVGEGAFLRMTKNPKNFDIQYCKIEGVRSELFNKLISILELKDKSPKEVELLDVVRNLCQFVAQLPDYVRNTKKLSKDAIAVRDVILDAHEPVKMVFHDLPIACGCAKFEIGSKISSQDVQRFINSLKNALDELRTAFPALQARLQSAILNGFDETDGDFVESRRKLSDRAEAVLLHVTEMKLKAFCLRLFDSELAEAQWIESMGNFLALKPPTRWKDDEEDLFNQELLACTGLFKRTESVVFVSKDRGKSSVGLRVAVTRSDGEEQQQVLHFNADDEEKLVRLQNEIDEIIKRDNRLGVAAASRAIWHQLKKTGMKS